MEMPEKMQNFEKKLRKIGENSQKTLFSTLMNLHQVMLDDHIIKTLAMRGSAFVKPFDVEVRNWYDQLMRVNRIFDEWMRVQNKWLYLLPILTSDKDIPIELPDEQQLFIKVNGIYCEYVNVSIRPNQQIPLKFIISHIIIIIQL